MELIRIGANKLRNSLGTLVDRVERGDADVIVTRYLRPIVVMIPYRDYLALKAELDAIRAEREAEEE
jgi:prevent-host-death family protein